MERIFIGLANVQKLPRTLALCVIVLSLPSLAIGFQADDFVIARANATFRVVPKKG